MRLRKHISIFLLKNLAARLFSAGFFFVHVLLEFEQAIVYSDLDATQYFAVQTIESFKFWSIPVVSRRQLTQNSFSSF